MKPRVALVTAGHLSTCPRMLKAADALAGEGYEVMVVSTSSTAWAEDADFDVLARRLGRFRSETIDYSRGNRPGLYLQERSAAPDRAFHRITSEGRFLSARDARLHPGARGAHLSRSRHVGRFLLRWNDGRDRRRLRGGESVRATLRSRPRGFFFRRGPRGIARGAARRAHRARDSPRCAVSDRFERPDCRGLYEEVPRRGCDDPQRLSPSGRASAVWTRPDKDRPGCTGSVRPSVRDEDWKTRSKPPGDARIQCRAPPEGIAIAEGYAADAPAARAREGSESRAHESIPRDFPMR